MFSLPLLPLAGVWREFRAEGKGLTGSCAGGKHLGSLGERDSGVIICPHPGLGWLLLQEKQERFSTSILWYISISKSCLFSRFLIFLHNVYVVHGGVGLYLICWVCERSLSLLAWRGLDITSSLLLCLGARPQETGAAFIFQELPVVVIPPLNSHTCVARAKVGFLSQLFMSSPCR